MSEKDSVAVLLSFLPCRTPQAWLDYAIQHVDLLLIDHAHCEKKAAATALHLLFRYVEYDDLLYKMSRLAREELRHFEKVFAIIQQRQIPYKHLKPGRYADALRRSMRSTEPEKLIDILIIGALIEARSCERFASLVPLLDEELSQFYQTLLTAEARHFQDYLSLAQAYAQTDLTERIAHFKDIEQELITTSDAIFRFHSGLPIEV